MSPVRSPDHDSQPAAELPEHDGCTAAPKPWFAQFAEGRHGRTNAKHHGSVPTDAIISGMDSLKSVITSKDAKVAFFFVVRKSKEGRKLIKSSFMLKKQTNVSLWVLVLIHMNAGSIILL